eukprot:234836_1
MSSSANYSLNATTFQTENVTSELECNKNNYKQCQSVNRLFAALKHYSMLNIMESENDRDIFMNFMNDIYCQLIDDYIHLSTHHSRELEIMYVELTAESMFGICEI